MSPARRHIVAVFLKLPQPGRVKTRLGAEMGAVEAAEIYRHLAEETLRHLPWALVEVWICFDPAERRAEVEAWIAPLLPADACLHFIAQVKGDLGARMHAVMEAAFALPQTTTLTFLGTDCPDVRWPVFVITERMEREALDAVFGPAEDGGYYLLALRRPCPELFAGIPWSSIGTLAASLAAADRAARKVHLLERRLRDIDTAEDYRVWQAGIRLPVAPA